MGDSSAAVLAIDFGTSSCVVAVQQGSRREVVEIAGATRTPSVLFAEDDGGLALGHVADELAATRPGRALRSPKSRLGQRSPVVLGGRALEPVDLVATLLGWLYREAIAVVGEVEVVVLTHPATWSGSRLEALVEAARRAGLPGVRLEPEPVAAAAGLLDEVDLPVGSLVAVYDLGAGTFDAAVVERTAGGFSILGDPDGDDRIGGDLFDELFEAAIGPRLGEGPWEALQAGDDQGWVDCANQLRRSVRRAKELLSSHDYAELAVALPAPHPAATLRVTRAELAPVLATQVQHTVDRLSAALHRCGAPLERLRAVHLVGGASAMPAVIDAVRTRFPTVACIRRADPKSVVALGALALVAHAAPTPEALADPAGPGAASPAPAVAAAVPVGLAGVVAGNEGRRSRGRLTAKRAMAGLGAVAVTAALSAVALIDRTPGAGAQERGIATSAASTSAAPDTDPDAVERTTRSGQGTGTGSGSSTSATSTTALVTSTASSAVTVGAVEPAGAPVAQRGAEPATAGADPTTAGVDRGAFVVPVPNDPPASGPSGDGATTTSPPVPTTVAPTTSTTAAPAQVPGAPAQAQLTTVWVAAGSCVPIRSCLLGVRLQVGAPAADGGAPVAGYRVVGTAFQNGTVHAVVYDQVLAPAAVLDVTVQELDLAASHIRWEIAAVNAVGTGPSTIASAVVPQLVGTGDGTSYEFARAAGLVAGGLTPQPGCGPEYTICAQSIPAGTVVPSGTAIGLVSPS